MVDENREGKTIKSAYDSSTFDADISIHAHSHYGDCGAATISPSGRDVAIASKFGLDIIDLDSPLNPPRRLRHPQSWNVADVQWSPFAARDYWVASTSNQKAIVWNLSMPEDGGRGSIEHTLQAHTRAITDINFSAHHPDILATCAVDGYVHCWDLRKSRRPVMTFCDWDAGATQVKWNRQVEHILASSHDRWLRIWDDRKGAYPLRSIEAHSSKIYGVDWNRTRATGVVTCSLDRSIKFWDYENKEDQPERIIRVGFPVWRARHTPFGWGLLAMPQDVPGKLHLYDRRVEGTTEDTWAPEIAVFPGHGDKKVKEFLWRSRGAITDNSIDDREFQLVSWGEDQELRLQRLNSKTLESVGYMKGNQLKRNLNVTRKGAIYKTFRSVEGSGTEKVKASIRGPRALSDTINRASFANVFPRSRTIHNGAIMKGKAIEQVKRDQVDWMSGIKFNRRTSGDSDSRKAPPGRRLSVLSPNLDPEWDSTETLHDEIIRVYQQYTKVEFDKVDMDKRTVTVSMNGPWGEAAEPVYIKASLEFPDHYPEVMVPNFILERTSLITEITYQKIVREVQQIMAGFVGKKRGCLETTVCYLLGDINLEESVVWFDGIHDDVEDIEDLADESSSEDDDDDLPAGSSALMSQELGSSATEGPINCHANVPTPRLCGARFTDDGRLICFFPPKTDKVKSLLGANVNGDREEGASLFNIFARPRKNELATPQNKFAPIADDDGEASDSSRDSDTSSSASDSSRFRGGVTYGFWRKIHGNNNRNGLSTNRSQISSAAGTGTGTGTGTRGSGSRLLKSKDTVVLHDTREFIPAKQELADEYAIFGDGFEVCRHNALIAQKHGYQDLADIWHYSGMLLRHEVPLEVLNKSCSNEPLLVIARDMITRCDTDSGSDNSVDLPQDIFSKRDRFFGKVKWGYSPLAKDLINELFEYFERLADIQMLAMLSCVFSEPSTSDSVPRVEMQLSQSETQLSMKTPGFSLEYFPSGSAALSGLDKTTHNSTSSTPKTAHTPAGFYGSLGSSNGGAWGSDPNSASYSCGETPPMKTSRSNTEKTSQQSQVALTLAEETRSVRRGNAGLASSLAANFTRSFSVIAPSSSPPNRKRPSPVETLINSLAPTTGTWGNSKVAENFPGQGYNGGSSFFEDDMLNADGKPLQVLGISVTVHNQDTFDDDGCLSTPLLDHSQSDIYSGYRRAYAELLAMWNNQLASLEIRKFDNLPDYFIEADASPFTPESFAPSLSSNNETGSNHSILLRSPMLLGKRDNSDVFTNPKGLDIAGYCLKHEYRLEPLAYDLARSAGGAIGRCHRCKALKTQLRCVICTEPVSTLYSPCLSCGCVSHLACLEEYQDAGERQCAGGCDCDCSLKAGIGVVEGWEVMMGTIELTKKQGGHRPRRSEDYDINEKIEWGSARTESGPPPSSPLGLGYSTLSRRLGQVRSSEWGGGLRRKGSLLRRDEAG